MQKDQRGGRTLRGGRHRRGGMNGRMDRQTHSEIKAVLFRAICISELTKMNIHRHNLDDPPGHAEQKYFTILVRLCANLNAS